MTTIASPSRKSHMATYILIGLIAGIALGFLLNKHYLATENEQLSALDISNSQVEANPAGFR